MTQNELNEINFFYKRSVYPQYRTVNFFNSQSGEVIFVVYDPTVSAFITLKDLITFNKEALKGIVTWLKTRDTKIYEDVLNLWMLKETKGWHSTRAELPSLAVKTDVVCYSTVQEVITAREEETEAIYFVFNKAPEGVLDFESIQYPLKMWLKSFDWKDVKSMGDIRKLSIDVKYWR